MPEDKYPTVHRVFITAIVIKYPDEQPPSHWALEGLLEGGRMNDVEVECRPLKDDRTWPSFGKPKQKRAYTCSICGGRHSARWCPERLPGKN